jgi:metal-sulfur cluster biosynthetic enzyme
MSPDADLDTPSKATIWEALQQVVDPCSVAHGRPLSVIEMGLVRDVEMVDGAVTVKLFLTSPICTMIGKFQEMAEDALLPLPGVNQVTVEGDNGLEWPGMPGAQRFTPLSEVKADRSAG